jgi:hypothetical protein
MMMVFLDGVKQERGCVLRGSGHHGLATAAASQQLLSAVAALE